MRSAWRDLGLVPAADELVYDHLAEHEPGRVLSAGFPLSKAATFGIVYSDTGWLPEGATVDADGMVSGGWPTDAELAEHRAKMAWVHGS